MVLVSRLFRYEALCGKIRSRHIIHNLVSACTDCNSKRVFLLGPSHHFYLSKAALSKCTEYETPIGNLTIDQETTTSLHKTGVFEWMSQSTDEDEHSLEMHLPYIYKMLSK